MDRLCERATARRRWWHCRLASCIFIFIACISSAACPAAGFQGQPAAEPVQHQPPQQQQRQLLQQQQAFRFSEQQQQQQSFWM